MPDLFIDIETYSSVSLEDCGVYRYSESTDFDVLLLSYSLDGKEVRTYDLAKERLSSKVVSALLDERYTKWAFNASFERVCLSRYLMRNYCPAMQGFLPSEQWRCDMVAASYAGLPLSLASAGQVLRVEMQKMAEGKALIKKFSVPDKNGNRTLPEDAPDDWATFLRYNKRDVETEKQIHDKIMSLVSIPPSVWEEYALDQRINDAGVRIDPVMVGAAVCIDQKQQEVFQNEMKRLTGLSNPKSPKQVKDWLASKGIETESLDKKAVAELIKTAPADVCAVLRLRQKASKSSTAKYKAMLDLRGEDDRVRGCFQFYGSHTGRWSGRHIQLQNLPQNHMPDLEEARALVRQNNTETLALLYDNVPQVLSELIRTALIPSDGYRFCVADFSAIEARVLAWLAGENWRTEVFRNGGDIYCSSASKMFGVPVEKHSVNGHLRQKGKIAELALGYGGSVGALTAMGALDMGIPESELKPLVDAWRTANPNIVRLWHSVDAAVKAVIRNGRGREIGALRFRIEQDQLIIMLPSGRELVYRHPAVKQGKYGSDAIYYNGVGMSRQYCTIETNGARLVENIVQAISRDLLAGAMMRVSARGLQVVAHVHDEMICEARAKYADRTLEVIIETMCELPVWGEGLVLNAAGYVCDFYQKD